MSYRPSYPISSANNNLNYGNISVFDMVRPEMRDLVSTYWAQFLPMDPLWHKILMGTILTVAVFGMIGNFVVINVFASTKSLRTPSNLLVVNLAFSDFLMMFCMAPPMSINCWNETWIFGPLACELYGAIGSLVGCVSIWTMTFIAFDRYHVIVKGITAKKTTKSDVMLRIVFIWALSIFWTVAPLFGWCRYVPEGNMTACGTDYISQDWNSRSYLIAYGTFVYFLPLFLIVYSYYFILRTVMAHEKNMRAQAKKMNVASLRAASEGQSTEFKLAKVALITISLWFMAWTPYLIINFGATFDWIKISPLTSIWGSVFAKCNAIYNPIVYGISHPKYREALQNKFCCCSANEKDPKENADEESKNTVVTA